MKRHLRGMILTLTTGKGGAEFHSKARQFGAYYGIPDIFPIDHIKSKYTFDLIGAARGLQVLAYFGHGIEKTKDPNDPHAHYGHGMSSAHIWTSDIPEFAQALKPAMGADFRLLLYACEIGMAGGMASIMSRQMGSRLKIFGHATVGHTTTNPNATYYPSPAGQEYVIPKNSPYWVQWCCKLKCDPKDTLWMDFPFMGRTEIEGVLKTWDTSKVSHHDKHCPCHNKHLRHDLKKPQLAPVLVKPSVHAAAAVRY